MDIAIRHKNDETLVYNYPGEHHDDVGPPVIMKSAAGWYIGDMYWDDELGGWFPWSRHTDYMTATEAHEYYETQVEPFIEEADGYGAH